jgi:hypothetical protein
MIDATSAIATQVAMTQAQAGLLAVRLAIESQRQMVELLVASVQQSANPAHLGNLVDTVA